MFDVVQHFIAAAAGRDLTSHYGVRDNYVHLYRGSPPRRVRMRKQLVVLAIDHGGVGDTHRQSYAVAFDRRASGPRYGDRPQRERDAPGEDR